MKPTLLIMAAGMGSRYGGLKQLDTCGISGETVMDYSVFDAMRSGFGKIVFVIRQAFEKEFSKKVLQKYRQTVSTDVVFQEVDQLPAGFVSPSDRIKPWGTNHAVMVAKSKINEPFAVINADDFYGKENFHILAASLKAMKYKRDHYIMVGYRIGNTLSENGVVSRGICAIDKDCFLMSIVERTRIIRNADGKISYMDEYNQWKELNENTIVSMNMWGFTPEYFDYSEDLFVDFFYKNQKDSEAEFFIPSVVNQLMRDKKIKIKVLYTSSKWFGVTYPKDRTLVRNKIRNLIQQGEYPEKLFELS